MNRWFLVGVVVMTVGCIGAASERCPDDSVCAQGRFCTQQADGNYYCASKDELAPCKDLATGDACNAGAGRCDYGLCVTIDAPAPGFCGDGIVQVGEVCDGEQCSANCQSDLSCGNGMFDPGETCDDGNQVSHDGCNAACGFEVPRWRPVPAYAYPRAIAQHAMTYDPVRGRVVMLPPQDNLATGAVWERTPDGGWLEAEPTIFVGSVIGHQLAYDSERGKVVMAGAPSPLGPGLLLTRLGLFEWSGENWSERMGVTNALGRRQNFGLAYDPVGSRLVVAGGRLSSMGVATYLDEAHALVEDTWVPLGALPARVDEVAMAFHPGRGKIILVGGYKANGDLLEGSFELDGDTWRALDGPAPPARFGAALAYDAVRGQLVLFGGADKDARLNDTWTLGATGGWVPDTATPVGEVPPARTGHALATIRDGVLLAGGTLASGDGADQHYIWRGHWFRDHPPVDASLPSDPGRYTFDPLHRRLISVAKTLDRILEHRGNSLRSLPILPAPLDPAHAFLVAYDEADDELVLFGGRYLAAEPVVSETVTYRGTRSETGWVLEPVVGAGPTFGHGASLAYDVARDVTVLVVTNPILPAMEVWELVGTTWTQSTAPAPPDRTSAALAYDRVARKIVMFGGVNSTSALGDTWTYDGQWTDVSPDVAPLPRAAAGVAWDYERGRLQLFGGTIANGAFDDAWEWTGAAWEPVFVDEPPRQTTVLASAPDGVGVVAIQCLQDRTFTEPHVRMSRLTYLSFLPVDACVGSDSDDDQLVDCDDGDCWHTCSPLCRPQSGVVCP